jgi:hypothetical protein
MARAVSEVQAYQAMIKFLSHYYKLTNSDDVGSLLGSMDLMADGRPADVAMWQEWMDCVTSVLEKVSE